MFVEFSDFFGSHLCSSVNDSFILTEYELFGSYFCTCRTIGMLPSAPPAPTLDLPPNCIPITAHLTANVWQVLVKPGDVIRAGDTLVILEAMKMEMTIQAEAGGSIEFVYCIPGQMVSTGQVLLAFRDC
jgi:Biotin-requiring enzyme